MVVVQLQGGLGNQLFQYAAGRALALRTRSSLLLDISQVGKGRYRPYRLDVFNLDAQPARKRDVPFEFRLPHRSPLARKVFARLPQRLPTHAALGPKIVREKGFAFDESVAGSTGDVYLVGFWQSPRYFEDATDAIRADLALTPQSAGVEPMLAAKLQREGTVSVHVRRGDYVDNPLFSPCSADYYRQALELLADGITLSAAYVFSDDIEWARREVRFTVPTVFMSEVHTDSDIADFYLMSQCHHHVIANSSFSWWAAWLGDGSGCVVSPRRWFDDTAMDTRDLRPAHWLVL